MRVCMAADFDQRVPIEFIQLLGVDHSAEATGIRRGDAVPTGCGPIAHCLDRLGRWVLPDVRVDPIVDRLPVGGRAEIPSFAEQFELVLVRMEAHGAQPGEPQILIRLVECLRRREEHPRQASLSHDRLNDAVIVLEAVVEGDQHRPFRKALLMGQMP